MNGIILSAVQIQQTKQNILTVGTRDWMQQAGITITPVTAV